MDVNRKFFIVRDDVYCWKENMFLGDDGDRMQHVRIGDCVSVTAEYREFRKNKWNALTLVSAPPSWTARGAHHGAFHTLNEPPWPIATRWALNRSQLAKLVSRGMYQRQVDAPTVSHSILFW